MRKLYLSLFIIFFSQLSFAQIVQWTFETIPPTTAGPHAADVGTGNALGFHAGATTYSNPTGNGSLESFSSTNWAIGDYYQFQFATTGFQNIMLTWDAFSSGTGPRDFKIQYSTDGSSFTDAIGTNSTYQVANTPAWSSGSYNATFTRTLDLSGVSALNNSATVYIRMTVTSTTSSSGATIAAGGTSRVDNVSITGNIFSSNTLTLTTLSSTTFNLPDCVTGATGTVDFTSTGTFNGPNVYTAELSDATGSFASPVTIGTFASTANAGTINITIPAGTVSGTLYKIRIRSSDPAITSNLSADITINLPGGCSSAASDFFRSRASGNWNVVSTWESSPTGLAGSWINATLTPTSAANTISILNGHTVAVTAAVAVDQVVIENGGIVNHTAGTITVEDGTGDDINIQSGGVLRLALVGTPPSYGAGSPVINVSTGGILRVAAGGMTGVGTGVNANNVVYQHQSILEWAPSGVGSFSTSNVIYFPNVATNVIPIFRSSNPVNMTVGSANPTIFNGVFEAVADTVIFEAAGTKTFRNGIRGSVLIDGQNGSSQSGQFIINGTTAELGGTGGLILSTTNGMQIGSATGTTVTVSNNKVVTGNVSLVTTNTYVELGTSNLTVTGTVTGGSATSYIRTNGTGSFILNNVTALRNAPIGNARYNPLTITHADGINWTLRVVDAVAVADSTFLGNVPKAVQREWHITPSVNPPTTGADIVFQWDDSDPTQVGASYNPNENVQVWHEVSQGSPWGDDWLAAGPAQTAGGTIGAVRTATITNWTWFSPFAVSNISGPLPVRLTGFTATKINDRNARITWELAACCSRDARFELEKSTDGVRFSNIKSVEGSETSRFYEQYDINLGAGITYYRLKAIDVDGRITYSRVAAIINGAEGLVVSAPAPNPVSDVANVVVTLGGKETVAFMLADLNGRIVRQWQTHLPEGNTVVNIRTELLPAGIYYLSAMAGAEKAVVRFVKQ